jgi:hypothetical protein
MAHVVNVPCSYQIEGDQLAAVRNLPTVPHPRDGRIKTLRGRQSREAKALGEIG